MWRKNRRQAKANEVARRLMTVPRHQTADCDSDSSTGTATPDIPEGAGLRGLAWLGSVLVHDCT
jgi:hypothetical protein